MSKKLFSAKAAFFLIIGGLIGTIFPIIFAFLDIIELEQDFSYESLKYVFSSQAIYSFSLITFPLIFGVAAVLTFLVNDSKRELKLANENQKDLYKKLVETAKEAGKAEIATGVLHNVGNVLNSINISADLVADQYNKIPSKKFEKLVGLLVPTADGQPSTIFEDKQKTEQFTKYMQHLVDELSLIKSKVKKEINEMQEKVELIKVVVHSQQEFAKSVKIIDDYDLKTVVEKSVDINRDKLQSFGVNCQIDLKGDTLVRGDSSEIFHVFVNIISNAINALEGCNKSGHQSLISIFLIENSPEHVIIGIRDNGIGMSEETLTKVFEYGFTTRREGHGFGLHSCSNFLKELGGSIRATSDGPDLGSTFIIEVPRVPKSIQ